MAEAQERSPAADHVPGEAATTDDGARLGMPDLLTLALWVLLKRRERE